MGITPEGDEIYIYVCHAHQHGIMSFTKIREAHDTYDFDGYDGLSDEFDMAFDNY